MKKPNRRFTGRGKSFEDARHDALNVAVEANGPDAIVAYSVERIGGNYGGIAGIDQVVVTIETAEVKIPEP